MQVVSYTSTNFIFQDTKNESEILEILETMKILPLLGKQNVIHHQILQLASLKMAPNW